MTNRRSIQFAKRVEMWQKRLGPLGLAQYTIDRIVVCESPGGEHSGAAAWLGRRPWLVGASAGCALRPAHLGHPARAGGGLSDHAGRFLGQGEAA